MWLWTPVFDNGFADVRMPIAHQHAHGALIFEQRLMFVHTRQDVDLPTL